MASKAAMRVFMGRTFFDGKWRQEYLRKNLLKQSEDLANDSIQVWRRVREWSWIYSIYVNGAFEST